jgi:hypothetical protein
MSEHFFRGSNKRFEFFAILGENPLFEGIWFSGFVRMGPGGQLKMIATRKVRAVSKGGGDSKCLNITAIILFMSFFVAG